MADPFEKDELLLDDEWVELCDLEGNRASFRHLATIGVHQNTYMILGAAFDEMDEPGALMLIREDETVDGVSQYVVVKDTKEIEMVIGRFVMRLLTAHLDDESFPVDDADSPCGCRHRPWEFCYCDDPAYLQ